MIYCDFPGLENGDLKTNPNEIVEKVTDRADLFTGFIHENYLEYFPDIQSAFKCAENLELASRLAKDSVILCQARKFNLSATFYCLMMITPFGIGIAMQNSLILVSSPISQERLPECFDQRCDDH